MTRYVDEDLRGAEFRERDLTGARLIVSAAVKLWRDLTN
jgi:hypothetical protein